MFATQANFRSWHSTSHYTITAPSSNLFAMAPRVHLIRHAEGYHQLEPTQKNELLHDPDLTLAGVANCKQFASSFPEYIRLDLICSSPMRRAIQTAKYCFPSQLERDGPLLLVPLAQENTDLPCDTGSNPAALMQEFGNLVDASMVEEGWNSKTGIYASAPAALEERARQFRAWLKQRPEQDVAVVGHGVFWHYVTGSVDASGNQTGELSNKLQMIRKSRFLTMSVRSILEECGLAILQLL